MHHAARVVPSFERSMEDEITEYLLTCRPALAEWDFCVLPAASLGPAFPPVDLPFPPAISRVQSF